MFLSGAEGQRPRNYLSCHSSSYSWIFCLIYALSTSTNLLPLHFSHSLSHLHTYLPLHTLLPMSTYQHIPAYVNIPSSTYLPLPIPKYRYIIAADPGTGIGLVVFLRLFVWSMHYQLSPTSYPLIFPS